MLIGIWSNNKFDQVTRYLVTYFYFKIEKKNVTKKIHCRDFIDPLYSPFLWCRVSLDINALKWNNMVVSTGWSVCAYILIMVICNVRMYNSIYYAHTYIGRMYTWIISKWFCLMVFLGILHCKSLCQSFFVNAVANFLYI